MLTLVTCVIAKCDECRVHPDMDDVDPHFVTASQAIEWLREIGWRVFTAGFMVCPDCSARHDCEVYGHEWTDWRQCSCAGHSARHGSDTDDSCPRTYRMCDRCSRVQELHADESAEAA